MKQNNKVIDYLLMFYFLALSGNPFVSQNIEISGLITLLFSTPIILKHKKALTNRLFLFIIFFFLGFEVFHSVIFEVDYFKTIIKIVLLYIFAYALIIRLGVNFIDVYVKTMVIISLISFLFFILSFIPNVNTFLYELAVRLFPLTPDQNNYTTPTFIIFTFDPSFINGTTMYPRNAGIFWEAGAFGTFLCMAYFLYLVKKIPKKISDLFDKNSLVLFLAILTTTSTTTYLAFSLILITFSFNLGGFYKIFMVLLFIPVMYISFNKIPFLKEKINYQLETSDESANRFGSLLLDWEDIKKRPLTGWSRKTEILFQDDIESSHRPNGISNLIRSYGFIYFIIYMYLIFYSLKNITSFYSLNKNYALIGLFLILILAFSQLIFDKVFFRGFVFLSITYGFYKKNNYLYAQ